MKSLILSKNEFTSKIGTTFIVLHLLLEDGTVSEQLLNKEEYLTMNVDESKFLDKDDLKELFDSAKDNTFVINYNKRGRVGSIT